MATNYVDIGARVAPDIGAMQADATAPTTTIRPSADVADGGWLNESGNAIDLFASVDDNPTDDGTWIESPLSETANLAEIQFADPGGLPGTGAGTLTIRHRAVSRRGLAVALDTL